jgi:5-dehydro-2-deoxygluconokinase
MEHGASPDQAGQRVYVVGRVSFDLNPMQSERRLEDVETFSRSVGGFAGNVCTGLGRLGIPTSIVSAVGDDGQGRYIRAFLASEGVDVRALLVHPTLRTALAFYELWPPDTFPITLFRSPTCPDWELQLTDLPVTELIAGRLVLLSGTGLAREPSRGTTLALATLRRMATARPDRVTVLDLDWRPMAWTNETEFGPRVRQLLPLVDIAVGGDGEFEAAGTTPADALRYGVQLVVLKHGPRGVSLLTREGEQHVAPIPVEVSCGLGAGDAFLAAFVAGVAEGRTPAEAVARGNAAGAIVATRPTCSLAMPTVAEVDAVMAGAPISNSVVLPQLAGVEG